MERKTHVFRFLDTDGDGGGTKNANGNYGTPTDFYIQPPVGTIYQIERLLVYAKDTATMDADKYGNNITLTNGINVQYRDDEGLVVDMLDGVPVKSNGGWARQCYDATVSSWGSGNEFMTVRWTFAKAGMPLYLKGSRGDKLVVTLEDDYSGLIEHYFQVQGCLKIRDAYTSQGDEI